MQTTALKSKRVLFVVNDAWFFNSHRLPIARALIKAGAEVHLLAREDKTVEMIKRAGIQFHSWNIEPRNTNLLNELGVVLSLFRMIYKLKPNFLHLVTIKPVLYGGIASRLLRVNSVIFAISGMGYLFKSDQSLSLKNKVLRFVASLSYHFALRHKNSAIIVQNNEDESFFVRKFNIPPSDVFRLPGSGVDLEKFQPNIQQKFNHNVVFAGRLLWDKGVGVFAESAAAIGSRNPELSFKIYGHTDPKNPRSVPEKALVDWENNGILQWCGHNENMHEVLQSADIFCLPTTYGEGIPKVLIEACASGCAVIATNWPGCTDIIEHEVNGLLVEPSSVHSLTEAIERLANDSELRTSLSVAARKEAMLSYSYLVVVEKTLAIYENLST